MMSKEIVYVSNEKVFCNGDNTLLGHPTIYLTIDSTNEILCPYCSKIFKKKNLSEES